MRQFTAKIAGGRALYIPLEHQIHGHQPIALCQVVINGDGELCLTPVYTESERQNHAANCAAKHASAIHAYRKRSHPDIMRAWDPELEEYVHGRRSIATGREPMPRG